jgi:hypothetical protein
LNKQKNQDSVRAHCRVIAALAALFHLGCPATSADELRAIIMEPTEVYALEPVFFLVGENT